MIRTNYDKEIDELFREQQFMCRGQLTPKADRSKAQQKRRLKNKQSRTSRARNRR